MLSVLDPSEIKVKVSSVLNRSSEFQAKNMLIDDDSCWNSAGAEPGKENSGQWLLLEFLGDSYVDVGDISIQFQGGFVGSEGIVECGVKKDALHRVCQLDHVRAIEDSNEVQSWKIPEEKKATCKSIKFLRITFPSSTDFFGRVTIYRLFVSGNRHLPAAH